MDTRGFSNFSNASTNLRVAEVESNKKVSLYVLSSIAGVLFVVLILIITIGLITKPNDSPLADSNSTNVGGGTTSGTSQSTETTTPCYSNNDCVILGATAFCGQNGMCVIPSGNTGGGGGGSGDNTGAGLTGFFAKFTGWAIGATPIYYTGGNVGIGTLVPEVALEVTDNAPGTLSVFKASTNTTSGIVGQAFNLVRSTDKYSGHQIYDQVRKISTTNSVGNNQLWRDYESKLQFGIANGRNGYIAQRYVDVLGTGAWQPSSMIFGNSKSVLPTASWNSVNNDYMIITYDGKVGIGTMNPVDFLQVKPGVNAGITLGSDNSGNPMLTFRSGASNNWKVTQYFTDGIQKWSMGSNLQDDFFLAPGAVGTPQLPVYIKVKQTSGAITFSNLSGAGSAYACINPAGTLYRSTTPCVA